MTSLCSAPETQTGTVDDQGRDHWMALSAVQVAPSADRVAAEVCTVGICILRQRAA